MIRKTGFNTSDEEENGFLYEMVKEILADDSTLIINIYDRNEYSKYLCDEKDKKFYITAELRSRTS